MKSTPPWKVDDWSLGSGLAKVEEQWTAIRELLEDPELFELRDESVSGWSCGQHGGHLAIVTRWIARGILENLDEPGRGADGRTREATTALLDRGDFPRGVAKSPPTADPTGRPRESLLPVLTGAIVAWRTVNDRATEIPDCPARFEHFALGSMTSDEWVRFCVIHTAHHLDVVHNVRTARGV